MNAEHGEENVQRVSKLSFKILLAESYLLHMSRDVRWPVFQRPCQYFTANLAKAGILKIGV